MPRFSPGDGGCPRCKERARRWTQIQNKEAPVGEKELRWIAKHSIYITEHAQRRCVERCLADRDIYNALRDGCVIERQKTATGNVALLVFSSKKIAKGQYRLLHLLLVLNPREAGTVADLITVYDPKTQPWRWDATFTRRVCFCKEKATEV